MVLFLSCYLDFFFSETKFSETETETFFRDQFFSKPKPRLFFPKPNLQKPKLRLFSKTKFFRNRTETFFPKPNFPKPKPSKIGQKFRNREVSKPKCQSLFKGKSNNIRARFILYSFLHIPLPVHKKSLFRPIFS